MNKSIKLRWGLQIPILAAVGWWGLFPSQSVSAADASTATCQSLTATESEDKNHYDIVATATTNEGARITGYMFDFGDRESYTFNFSNESAKDRQRAAVKHTYAKTGNYTVKADVISTKDGKTSKSSSPNCTATVTVGSQTGVLPATGPNDTRILIETIVIGMITYGITFWVTEKRTIRG